MRKLFSIFFVLLLTLLPAAASAEENLIRNGDFSAVDNELPTHWDMSMWITDAGVSSFSVSPDGYDGGCVFLTNSIANDARFEQTVSVEPDTLYRISGMCRAENIPSGGVGASISVENTFCYSNTVTDTQGEWVPLELYGRTGPEQTKLTVYLRIGGYSNENSGSAWFDSISMEAVDSAPAGTTVCDLRPFNSVKSQSASGAVRSEDEPARNTEMYVLLTVMYLLAVTAVARKRGRLPDDSCAGYPAAFICMILAAFALRAVLAVIVPGYNTDMNCFAIWSDRMASVGPAAFYNGDVWCDYPPLYMWWLGFVGVLRDVFGLFTRSGAHRLLLKLCPILFDLASACVVWHIARRRLGSRAALLLSAFLALNPAVIADSAAWGQIDSVFTLLVALCALEACEKRYHVCLLFFTLAMLVKPQALLFAPLGLFAIVVNVVREVRKGRPLKETLRGLIIGLGIALGIIYFIALISAWDSAHGLFYNLINPVRWAFELYGETMSGYTKMTVNALNVYYLLDMNWNETSLHPTATTVAWLLFALSYVYCAVLYAFSKERRNLLLLGGTLIMLIFTFGVMIHERYVFPAILLLLLSYVYLRDRRILISLAVLSATLFLNQILVLQGGMTTANYGHLQADENWINYIVCVVNLLNTLFIAVTALDICVLKHTILMNECEPIGPAPAPKRDHRLRLNRIDAVLMASVTLVYTIVAFTNLGTMKAPQTTYAFGSAGESVTFDLGETQSFRMTYYGNICDTNFTVEMSGDGEVWTQPYYAQYEDGEIFRWLWYVPSNADNTQAFGLTTPTDDGSCYVAFSGYGGERYPYQTARYVRITSAGYGLKICEVAFLDAAGEPLPVASALQRGEFATDDPMLLIDEQNVVPAVPSYFNSTYFDEIYHARTAYEHLHGLSTFEWTHPPLGKVLMMVGIQIFGMSPFGWRFMGALVGVLMVPLMYLLVKQLTKSTTLSFIAMLLLSVDAMHFTQTRIATIDSYAVFWIMLMYFFMFRYCQMSWATRRDFLRSLVPLGLCGVTMGVAWATKWIGLYASAGLAVLFFWTFLRHGCDWLQARRQKKKTGFDRSFPIHAAITVGFCLIFFVAIPVCIYYFSHFWYLRGLGASVNVDSFGDMFSMRCVDRVIQLQMKIFRYHAGLGSDNHYFRSPWYQWPVIAWPMWYYDGSSSVPANMVSSISCMGNPAVWWFGLAAMIFVIVRMCWLRRAPRSYVTVVIGFASQYLPWVLVPRSTFIYHYFASVPFIIMATVLLLNRIRKKSDTAFHAISVTLMTAALVLFILFYPLESGMPVARSFANCLRWFNWCNF